MDTFAQGRLQFENPFEIQKIVEVIAKSCDFGSLRNFRLVNRACFKGSLEVWREQAVLVVEQKIRGKITTGIEQPEVETRMGDPSNDFLQLGSKPFSSYKLFRWKILDGTGGASAQFWELVSPHIKHLHMDECRFLKGNGSKPGSLTWEGSLERIIFPNARGGGVAPNMEHLIIANTDFQHVFLGAVPFGPPGAILRFPKGRRNTKLKSLHLINRSRKSDLVAYDLRKLLKQLPNLENYTGPRSSWIEQLPSIRNIAVGSSGYLFDRTVKRNVVSFLNKLESVTLFEVTPSPRDPERRKLLPPLSMDTMENLKYFHIWGSHLAKNFNFLKAAPNLQVLKINLLCYEKRDDAKFQRFLQEKYVPPLWNLVDQVTSPLMKNFQVKLEGLVHLEIDFQFSADNLQVLKKWVPNLVVLKTILNDETFPVVCREWSTTLRELALLFGADVSDAAIVGSSMKDPCKDLHRGFNITNLEDLREFSFDAYCNQSKLGDASVFHGFLKMARLTNLRLCISAQMSSEAIDSLQREIQCVQIIYNFRPPPHLGYDCCGRLAFYCDAVEGTTLTRPPQPEPEPAEPIKKRLRSQK